MLFRFHLQVKVSFLYFSLRKIQNQEIHMNFRPRGQRNEVQLVMLQSQKIVFLKMQRQL